ncbi:MAG: hypothetical protein IIZ61_02195 [Lachnospiraceae bacterium]|nr:hypothetical protein [Lachnospiraceae bacterium]
MTPGVFEAKKKNGDTYYRTGITYRGKHVSLGSFDTEKEAGKAYLDAKKIYEDSGKKINLTNYHNLKTPLSHDKIITILNHRDNKMYIKTPIYLRTGYFSYFLDKNTELKFDNDDLFYYSSHRILRRQGHLYVNDYGMQYSILQRFGIKSFGVSGKDYTFANGDDTDYRYQNVIVINRYHGVTKIDINGMEIHETKIHLNGDFLIGRFKSDSVAAVAYNKAVDFAKDHGYKKQFIQNYVIDYSPKEYADVYTEVELPQKYIKYIESL